LNLGKQSIAFVRIEMIQNVRGCEGVSTRFWATMGAATRAHTRRRRVWVITT
jgi:hypothetical protein